MMNSESFETIMSDKMVDYEDSIEKISDRIKKKLIETGKSDFFNKDKKIDNTKSSSSIWQLKQAIVAMLETYTDDEIT